MTAPKGPPGFNLAEKPAMPGLVAEGDWHGHLVSISASGRDRDGCVATLVQLHNDWPQWEERIADAIVARSLAPGPVEIEAIYAHDGGLFELELIAPASLGRGIALATGSLDGGIDTIAKGG